MPGPFGIGDLGPTAYAFADFLEAAGQSLWQVLPLGPTGYGDSPYACYSAFAWQHPAHQSRATHCRRDAHLRKSRRHPEGVAEQIDFEVAHKYKDLNPAHRLSLLLNEQAIQNLRNAFAKFCAQHASWLDDYALFRALKDEHGGVAWNEWEPALVRRESNALETAKQKLSEEIEAQMFYQFLFFRQWFALKADCNRRGIKLVGDIPIFVAHDSADVWTNPDQFKLNEDGTPIVVAGVPPDYFSATGQLWGNPLYNWNQMQVDGFKWWIDRVSATLETFDIARIDHFRGFAACWEIPGGDKTAERGRWVTAPGRELFTAIREALGQVPINCRGPGRDYA